MSEPLQVYLDELAKVPALTPEREAELVRSGDLAAKRELVEAHLWLVVQLAEQYRERDPELLDLIECGNRGLMQAVDEFSNDKGCRFASYAETWIHKALDDYNSPTCAKLSPS